MEEIDCPRVLYTILTPSSIHEIGQIHYKLVSLPALHQKPSRAPPSGRPAASRGAQRFPPAEGVQLSRLGFLKTRRKSLFDGKRPTEE